MARSRTASANNLALKQVRTDAGPGRVGSHILDFALDKQARADDGIYRPAQVRGQGIGLSIHRGNSPSTLGSAWGIMGVLPGRVSSVPLLDFLYKNGLWISWPLCGLGVFLIWLSIATVVRVVENSRICSLPLTAHQEVDFAEAGLIYPAVSGALNSNYTPAA